MKQKNKMQKEGVTAFAKSPVIVVLGHVDHGKTSLLDYIRKSRITQKESGKITQHIGAYQIQVENKHITFIDTPGHEAFTNLRSRGAKVADIALLVIDAKESVKPQTVESIKIIQKEKIPVIVVINKIDLPDANPAKVKQDLLKENIVVEDHGGKVSVVNVSAKTGEGIDDLLDVILLVAEMKHISADPKASLEAVVIEARRHKGKGNIATVIVQNGTLTVRDSVYTDTETFTVRALFDEFGKSIKSAYPGMPVELLGFSKLPAVGSVIRRKNDAFFKIKKETDLNNIENQMIQKMNKNEESVLDIFLKADTYGSLEAIIAGLPKEVSVCLSGVGDIVENDIVRAKEMNLVVIGFNVKVPQRVEKLAKAEKVRIRTYSVIYKLFEEIGEVVEILQKGPQKEIIGEAKILKLFDTSQGKIAGCIVENGRLAKGDTVRIFREGKEIIEGGKIVSLRCEKLDVQKVKKGKTCGVLLRPQVDMKVGDMIQSYILYKI